MDIERQDLSYTGPLLFNKAINRFLQRPDNADFPQQDFLPETAIKFLKNCKGVTKVDSTCKGEILLMNKYQGYYNEMNSNKKEIDFKHYSNDLPVFKEGNEWR